MPRDSPIPQPGAVSEWFARAAGAVGRAAGTPWAFAGAFSLVLAWALSGPIFGFSTTWQLMINTGTTIVTFLMVFLIQNGQSRDTKALHLKLDAIIAGLDGPANELIDAEDLTVAEMAMIEEYFRRLAKKSGGTEAVDRPSHASARHLLDEIRRSR